MAPRAARSQEVVARIPVDAPIIAMAVDPATNAIYCSLDANLGPIVNIDTGTDIPSSFLSAMFPAAGLAFDGTNHRLYAAVNDNEFNTMGAVVFDSRNQTKLTQYSAASTVVGAVVNPGTNTLYLSEGGSVEVFDGALQIMKVTINIGVGAYSMADDPATNRVYVIGSDGPNQTLSAIDCTSNTVVAMSNTVAEPVGAGTPSQTTIAVNTVTNTVYVDDYSGAISAYDGTTLAFLSSTNTVPASTAIAVNSVTNKLFVASGNSVYELDPAISYNPVAVIQADYSMTQLVVNETTNLVYANSGNYLELLVIDPLPVMTAAVTLGGLNQTFDGTSKFATVTTVPPGLATRVTYSGGQGPNYVPGSYAVVATVVDPRYTGSATGTLTISSNTLPVITVQPSQVTVIEGQNARFSVVVSSPTPVVYSWSLNGTRLDTAFSNGSSYSVVGAMASESGDYSVTATNSSGSVTSSPASLTVNTSPASPVLTTQPASQSVSTGAAAVFWATASGVPSPTFQWSLNGTPLAGATLPMLEVNSVTVGKAGSYTVAASNSSGSVTSQAATLSINSVGDTSTPSIASEPSAQTVANGSTVVFSVSAAAGLGSSLAPRASETLAYQWLLNGSLLSGATSSTLLVQGATPADAGDYACVVSDSAGSAVSSPAALAIVDTSDPGRLINLSCLASVGTGVDMLVAGFVVGGTGTSGGEQMLVRASGPVLGIGPFDLQGVLPDPELTLANVTASLDTVVATDTGWDGSIAIEASAAMVGAYSWSRYATADSAIVGSLPSGNYTATVSGESGDTGVSLAEIYDATPAGTYTASMPRLINLSARVQTGSGSSTVVAGFVIGGTTSKTVLIRISGPSLALAPFNLTGTLPDPVLTLMSTGANPNTSLATRASWGGDPTIAAVAASVGAFPWTGSGNDSALIVTLPPGNYSVGVAGASGDAGVALIEVYDVE